MTSFVVAQTLSPISAVAESPRYYELADGSLSMEPVRCHSNGTQIYSAERLLVDIEDHLSSGVSQIILTRFKSYELKEEDA